MSSARFTAVRKNVLATSTLASVLTFTAPVQAVPLATTTGPSSSQTPYLTPTANGWGATSLLTTGDSIGGYVMSGIPDGLGAFDNGNGTISVLMNHELGAGQGPSHGVVGAGAFVSKWTIDKNTLQVISGSDLITTLNISSGNTSLNRLCSADLAPISAFYNSATGNGYNGRIFLNGEEGGSGRAFGTVVSGAGAVGTATQLARLGTQGWENWLANPATGDKTLVIGNDDTSGNGNGQVFVYLGDKQTAGSSAVEQAGLTNGKLYAIKVAGFSQEDRATTPGASNFSLVELGASGDVTGLSVAALNTDAVNKGASSFLRPEDGAWNPKNPKQYFFVTTDQYDQVKDGVGGQVGRTRLWQVDFVDPANPTLGGAIKPVLDGTEATQMLDNMTIGADGIIYLQEDVGGQDHNGKLWAYDPATGKLTQIFQHDTTRFGNIGLPAALPFTTDEESSGIIDVTKLFTDAAWYQPGMQLFLADVQAHYPNGATLIEGGQLLLLSSPVPEPGTMALFLGGIAGLCFARRRKNLGARA
jgi:hypothetical protein